MQPENLEPIQEVELDDDLLFDESASGPAETESEDEAPEVDMKKQQAAHHSSDDELADFPGAYSPREQREPLQENSAKSSTLHVSLEEADAQADAMFSARGHPIAASVPVTSHIQMGSSMPIAVPHMGRWKRDGGANGAAPDSPIVATQHAQAATFVPPHQLSHVNDFMFSFTGDSPSVAIKRERLRARNAILKSTGFLEPGVMTVNNIGLQERNRLAVGGLSQALQGGGAIAQ